MAGSVSIGSYAEAKRRGAAQPVAVYSSLGDIFLTMIRASTKPHELRKRQVGSPLLAAD